MIFNEFVEKTKRTVALDVLGKKFRLSARVLIWRHPGHAGDPLEVIEAGWVPKQDSSSATLILPAAHVKLEILAGQ